MSTPSAEPDDVTDADESTETSESSIEILPPALRDAIAARGYTDLTPVQTRSTP